MPHYVLLNRCAGKFTDDAKRASRDAVAEALGRLTRAKVITKVISDYRPKDPRARRVVIFKAAKPKVERLKRALPPHVARDVIIETTVTRSSKPRATRSSPRSALIAQLGLAPAIATHKLSGRANYGVTVTGSGKPLAGSTVKFYLRDRAGSLCYAEVTNNKRGWAELRVPNAYDVAFVSVIPYASHWSMFVEAPERGSLIECFPLAPAMGGGAWWHRIMGIDVNTTTRGKGIRVGVIDTGCGPHPNLAHVKPAGVFFGGRLRRGIKTSDVEKHGTHTTGIIGARPTQPQDYAGMAPKCDLFHARVYKTAEEGPNQADIANAIDALSREYDCDLINMSLGEPTRSVAEEDAIQAAFERGTLCICSAGNNFEPAVCYPAAYRDCIAVSSIGRIGWAPAGTFSAIHRPKKKAELMGRNDLFFSANSNFGATRGCAAPGVGIISTVPDRRAVEDLYAAMDGTSMASPAVCGALAVILSKNARYKELPRDRSRAEKARKLLVKHCENIDLARMYVGHGLPRV